MAEFSGFWTTGASAGDQQSSGYTQAHMSTAGKIMAACGGFEGVAPGYLNDLAGSVTGANTVSINTGGAMVDGKWYENSAATEVNIPSASGVGWTRIDRVVLRASWGTTFTVRITVVSGTNAASPTAPAITQTSGTTYDILLYQALVDTAGTVTLTDERLFASAFHLRRQGGNATNWTTGGTTNYTPTNQRIQCGSYVYTPNAANGGIDVTFPVAFSGAPLVFVTPVYALNDIGIALRATGTTTGITMYWSTISGAAYSGTLTVNWLAIGPE